MELRQHSQVLEDGGHVPRLHVHLRAEALQRLHVVLDEVVQAPGEQKGETGVQL